MNTRIIGITSANGYQFLSFDERFALYEKCGFGSIMLWWGEDDSESRENRVLLAMKHNLIIENVHSNMYGSNALWLPGETGDMKMNEHIRAIEDCRKFGIKRMVMHLTNGENPPCITDIGVHRIGQIVASAIKNDVILAIENVRTCEHVKYILDNYTDSHVTFCYDSGHANLWCRDVNWLSLYASRLSAIHLHDNRSDFDAHDIPFKGTIDWNKFMQTLKHSSYTGSLTLETEYRGKNDIYELEIFLHDSFISGLKLAEL